MTGAGISTLRAWPSRDENGRTKQKVRRDSREALPVEPAELLSPRQRRARISAFRRHASSVRIPGKRRGARGTYSLYCADVLDYLMYHAVQTGRIFPSYEDISAAVGCAYRTAVNCVRQLAAGGWVSWERRFVRVGSPGQAEPQVVQTSNLYRLALPNAARALIDGWKRRRPPAPDDVPDDAVAAVEPDTEAAISRAVAEAERGAQRRNQHLLSALAAARTPHQVEAVLTGRSKMQGLLDKLEAGLRAKGEGSSTAASTLP